MQTVPSTAALTGRAFRRPHIALPFRTQATAFACDVTDPESVQETFDAIRKQWPSHQVKAALYNVNSPFLVKRFLETSLQDIKPGVDVNFYGAFHFSQKVLPLMLEGGGGFLGFTGATAALKGEAERRRNIASTQLITSILSLQAAQSSPR